MKSIVVLFFIMSIFTNTSCLYAEGNTCRLSAPSQDDVWVIVYDADGDGNRGKILWQGKISAGQEISVTSTDGHIRYDYTRDKDQPYEGDIAVECYEQKSVLVD